MLWHNLRRAFLAAAVAAWAAAAQAVSVETVRIGDPGNAGELSGAGAGGYGTDRICGEVDYTYRIGKYEVTAGQYTAFLNAVAATDTYGLYNASMWSNSYGCKIQQNGASGSYTYSVAADMADRPVNYVSWGDAARFANWLHNGQPTGPQNLSTTEDGAYYLNGATTQTALVTVTRKANWKWSIPSEDEWYKAAYYHAATTSYYDYPTGSNTAPGRDLADASGNNANYRGTPFPIDSGKYTTRAGEFQNSRSPYGTFDQGGNVWEWNEAVMDASRGMRGGAFDYYFASHLLASDRNSYYPPGEDGDIGFRVARIPEPASIALLLSGAAAGLIWWIRRKQHP